MATCGLKFRYFRLFPLQMILNCFWFWWFFRQGLVRFEDEGFPSVRELLDHHVTNRVPVTKKSNAILCKPVLKDKWELCRDNIVLEPNKLGQGHFGDVMKGILKPENIPVAVKSCKQNVSQVVKTKFLAEAEILKQYDHPNIVKLIGVCAEKEPVFIGWYFLVSLVFSWVLLHLTILAGS